MHTHCESGAIESAAHEAQAELQAEWIAEDAADGATYDDPVLLSERTPREPHIKIVVFPPHDFPHVVTIDNTLSAMQKMVGGRIEVFPVGVAEAVGVCNDDFIGEGLPPNRYVRAAGTVIAGTFFVAGDGVEMRSLTDDQIMGVLLTI